jgi:hypothetical protein
MSATTPINIYTYKAVIVLNNIGITLLERQRYNDAQITLKEAIDLMSCLRDKTRLYMSQEKQSQFLNHASKRIAQSTKAPVVVSDGDDDSMNMDDASETSNVSLTVLSQHDTAHNTKEIVSAFHTSCSSIVHRLEFIDEASINLVTDTAILLHNFSIAIRVQLPTVMSQHKNSKKLALHTKLIDFAYKIAQVADNVVNEHIGEMDTNICLCHHEDHMQYVETLQISMLIVQDLMVLSSMMFPDQTRRMMSQKYYCKLGHIRSMLLDMQDPSFDTLVMGYPAAQAA